MSETVVSETVVSETVVSENVASELDYEIVDVFADRAFAGNPLAVVAGAGDLSTQQLQAIAREFNLSETVFPMAPTPDQAAAGASCRLRIFTPLAELPFAGHPTVGAVWVLTRQGVFADGSAGGLRAGAEPSLVACAAGLVTVQADAGGARISAAVASAPARPGAASSAVTAVPVADPGPALAAVGLEAADLIDEGAPSYVASAGLPFWFLMVSERAVTRARASLADLLRLPAPAEVRGTRLARLGGVATVAWPDAEPAEHVAHARVFCPDLGTIEDPATGSAALALSAVLVSSERLPRSGGSSYVVRQGAEIGRPSTLRCDLEAVDGAIRSSWVGGDVVPVARGRIRVPDASS